MKLSVDSAKCAGHAMCYWESQELFDLDDDGKAFVVPGQEEVAPELQQAAREAVNGCPERAIEITE
jgi:ferredoxin